MRIQTGENVGIGGVIITGTAPKHVLLRAIGPSLTGFGVPDALADPVLELHGPGTFVTITDDNWRDDSVQEAAHTAGTPLRVQLPGDPFRIRVGFNDGIQLPVETLNPVQVTFGQLASGKLAGRHQTLQLGNAGLEPRSVFAGRPVGGRENSRGSGCKA